MVYPCKGILHNNKKNELLAYAITWMNHNKYGKKFGQEEYMLYDP